MESEDDFLQVCKRQLFALAVRTQIFELCSGVGQQAQFFDDDPVGSDSFRAFLVEQGLHPGIIHGHERVLEIKISFHFRSYFIGLLKYIREKLLETGAFVVPTVSLS
ncbi:hypothetical protein [Bacteroides stercorirosoris]|uniref:hypothetical protein n=2 Tax=Bacteroides stercorirosoris TaxID=871324 RepID=UPI0023F1673E|nr:hypothetical protein [Bacteroides stercorirosoris]